MMNCKSDIDTFHVVPKFTKLDLSMASATSRPTRTRRPYEFTNSNNAKKMSPDDTKFTNMRQKQRSPSGFPGEAWLATDQNCVT